MDLILKLGFLIYLTSAAAVVVIAAPVQDDLVVVPWPVDDTDDVHDRETRSPDSTGRLSIPWYLDRIDQRQSHRLNGKYNAFANGTGVDIYILADGIEHDNEELHGRAFDVEFIPPHYSQWRCNKFGTHIGSLAAGVYAGVAKSSMIYVPRITYNLPTCRLLTSVDNVVMAIQYVIKEVNMTGRRSVLAIPLVGRKSDTLNAAVENAIKKNIVVVTPAGNSFDDACRYSPGSSPNAINVGVTKLEEGKDKLYNTSNYGSCVSLYAPGEHKAGSRIAHVQACAIVSGAAALVLEKYPHYSPAEVKKYLIDEATDDAIDMKSLPGGKGTNKLLYVGNGDNVNNDDDSNGDNVNNNDGSASGDFFDDTIGNEDTN